MAKLWTVAWNEFRRHVFKRSFILMLLALPLMISVIAALGFVMSTLENDDTPVGYVDLGEFLDDPVQAPIESTADRIEIRAFTSEEAARQALQTGSIQAYYVFAADYRESNEVKLFFDGRIGEDAAQQFYDFVQANLLREISPEEADRVTMGTNLTIRSPDGSREFPDAGPTFGQILPLAVALAFILMIMMSSGNLMGGLSEERENRMMEVLMTSVSSTQMVAGKILAIVAVGMLQLSVWMGFLALAVQVAGNGLELAWFQNIEVNWGTIGRIVAVAFPSYMAAAALMFMLGATVAKAEEGQSVGAISFLLFFLPFYLIVTIVESPHSIPVIIMTLLPFMSLMTIALRSLFFTVPLWQVAASVVVQTGFALLAIWLAGRAFRLGMLRYGKGLSLKELLRREKAPLEAGRPL